MHRSAGNDAACPHTNLCTPGVSRATTPVIAVARPPVETPVPWEYPHRHLDLITLVGTTHDTSLLYAATRGRRVRHPCPTLMHGGNTAYHQAGTTCQIALAVIRRLPVPHNQAMRALLLRCQPLRCVQHRDGGRCTQISHTLSICITPGPHHAVTISSVMPQPEYPRVALQTRPPQQQGQGCCRRIGALYPFQPDAPQVTLHCLPGS